MASLTRSDFRILSPEEADHETAEYWRSKTPNERLELLEQLRMQWIPADERRLKRTFEFIEGL